MSAEARWRSVECLLVVLVFAASTFTGIRYLADQRPNPFGDFLSRAAMVACGQGFTAPGVETPALIAFSTRQRDALTCADVVGERPAVPPGSFAANHRNLIYTAATAMRMGGINWTTLDRYMSVLFGLSMALVYGLFRLSVGRALSVVGVALLACSDHIFQLTTLRDYSKEAWFVAAWLSLGWLLRRRGSRATSSIYLPAAVGGAVVGVGIGFRVDLMVCLPAFPAVIAMAISGWDRPALVVKGVAMAVFLAAFGITALPTLVTLSQGSNSGHVAVLGLTNSFTEALGLEPPLYELGNIYADGYTHTLIAAHAVVVQHDPVETYMGTAEYDRQGVKLLVDYAENFPADQIVRAYGATVQALRYPFTESARMGYQGSAMLSQTEPFETLTKWRASAFRLVDGSALWLAVLAIGAVYVRDWKLGAAVTFLVIYFCGYSMIQFSRRHIFHLDVIPVNVLLVVIQGLVALAALAVGRFRPAMVDAKRVAITGRSALTGALAMIAVVALLAGLLFATRVWQQQHVVDGISRSLAVAWMPLATTREPLMLLHDGVVEPTWGDIYRFHPERWGRPLTLVRVPPLDAAPPAKGASAIRWEYLRVDIGGEGCRARSVSVGMKYTGPVPTFDWEYTRTFEVPVDGSAQKSTLFLPVFYWQGSSRFDGVAVPSDQASCIDKVSRATAAVPYPMLAFALPPSWRTLPMYQRMAR